VETNPLQILVAIRSDQSHFQNPYGLLAEKSGILSFLLTLHLASLRTRYVDGLLMRIVKVKWKVRAQYSDPVLIAKRADIGERSG
jgi:hypothetical protein